jgi:methylenetetrahydrofolate dehydrogenase (NADP+)/methenyltetrahydrofolate cyclohydrolase
MTACIIDGKLMSKNIKDDISQTVLKLHVKPCLCTILVGDDPSSSVYVKNKHKACEEVGIRSRHYEFPPNVSECELLNLINQLNLEEEVHGILVQLPLPKHINEFNIISQISSVKDVDGLTKTSHHIPCTPQGILYALEFYKIPLESKTVVIINRSNLVGKPLCNLLLSRNATVIMCHSYTTNIKDLCSIADVIITAVGNRNNFTLTEEMIKADAVVIDVAITKYNGKLVGDADTSIITKAGYVTPVPGGIGPMTVAMLLKNTLKAYVTLNSQEL